MTAFLDRAAWQIDTPELRISILECGGHIAEVVYKPAGAVNPLWIQDVPTIDSDQYDAAVHGSIYGTDGEAKLISGLAGHNLCFPFWGVPSEAEAAAGMTAHGETNIVRWTELSHTANSLHLAALLPDSLIRFERMLTCEGQIIYFEETAHNLSAWDRPVAWCEHVTLGPPFLDPALTGFQASLTRGFRTSGDPTQEFLWPEGRGEIACELDRFAETRHSDLVNSFLVDPSREYCHFAAWNIRQKLLIGYVFQSREFPWMNVWECNDTRRQTRGMEFSTSPIEGTMRQLALSSPIWDVPVYEWLPAKGQLKKRYAVFVHEISETFSDVEDVHVSENAIDVVERSGGSTRLIWRPKTFNSFG